MYEFQPPLVVDDFSGGATDNYIDCPINRGQTVDNCLVEKNKKLISINGSLIGDSTNPRVANTSRIGAMIHHPEGQKFDQALRNLYYVSGGSYNNLTGPVDSNSALSSQASTNYISWSDWRKHTYISSDSYADPIKVYKDSAAAFKVNTAGLPNIELEGCIDLANSLRTIYTAHIADAAQHTTGVDAVNVISAAAAHDFDTLVTLVTELLVDYQLHQADANLPAGRLYHPAQAAASDALANTTAPKNLQDCIDQLTALKSKYNAHDADANSHAVLSSHQTSAVLRPVVTGTGSTNTYLYKFVYYYTYTVNDVDFEVFGPTSDTVTLTSNAPGTFSVTGIPAISNGTTRCYDTANIKVKIYRTIAAGTVFYYVGEVTNGTTTYSDTVADATLDDQELLYTEGGILSNDPPPRAKYVHVVNNIAWYAHVKEGTVVQANRIRPSKDDNPDACPEDIYEDMEAPITGISSINIYPIVFCRNRIYRLEGTVDEFGRGVIERREISKTDGCISNLSIVQIPQGLVFAGEDGFYFTDGYTSTMISSHLISRYADLVDTAAKELKIYGQYDGANDRVYWTVQADGSATECDQLWILDLTWGISPESCFTMSTPVRTFQPTSLVVSNRVFYIGDKDGYIFKYDENTKTNPKKNTSLAVASWGTSAIIPDYKGFATTFGSSHMYKFVPSITLQAKNITNATIQINRNKDDGNNFEPVKEIRFRNNITWGDADVLWNSPPPDYLWNVAPIIKSLRLFRQGRRCVYFQTQITQAYTIIYASDNYATAANNTTTKTVTLSSGSWPTDLIDYYIRFENDDYSNEFAIASRDSSTQITITDTANLMPTASAGKWQIHGYRKGEALNILSYSLNWAPLPQHQEVWRGVTGGNA